MQKFPKVGFKGDSGPFIEKNIVPSALGRGVNYRDLEVL